MSQLESKYRKALKQIVSGLTPCSECKKPHEPKFKKGWAPQWQAKDGHPYRRMTAQHLAMEVLDEPTTLD